MRVYFIVEAKKLMLALRFKGLLVFLTPLSARTIYNCAIMAKVASKDDYPFGAKGKIVIKFQESCKLGLSEAEIKKLELSDHSQHSSIYNDARNIWLTEFYFARVRVTDCLLLKWTDFQSVIGSTKNASQHKA